MMTRRSRLFALAVILSAIMLIACGKKGPLELPTEKSEKVHGAL